MIYFDSRHKLQFSACIIIVLATNTLCHRALESAGKNDFFHYENSDAHPSIFSYLAAFSARFCGNATLTV